MGHIMTTRLKKPRTHIVYGELLDSTVRWSSQSGGATTCKEGLVVYDGPATRHPWDTIHTGIEFGGIEPYLGRGLRTMLRMVVRSEERAERMPGTCLRTLSDYAGLKSDYFATDGIVVMIRRSHSASGRDLKPRLYCPRRIWLEVL